MISEDVMKIVREDGERWRLFLLERIMLLETEQKTLLAQISALNVKSGVWGFIAGAIPSATALIVVFLKS